MSKKSRFRGPFDKWHGKRAESLVQAERQHLYHIYWSLWRQLWSEKFLWMICKILGLFVNPLTADDRCSPLNRGNLLQHFQMHLPEKRKIFCKFFFTFSKFRVNFEHFQKKRTVIADVFWKLQTQKNVVTYMSKKSRLRGPFDKYHGKRD